MGIYHRYFCPKLQMKMYNILIVLLFEIAKLTTSLLKLKKRKNRCKLCMSINERLVKRIMTRLYHELQSAHQKTLLKRGENLQDILLKEKNARSKQLVQENSIYIKKQMSREKLSTSFHLYPVLLNHVGFIFQRTVKCIQFSPTICSSKLPSCQPKLPHFLPLHFCNSLLTDSNPALLPASAVYTLAIVSALGSLNKLWSSQQSLLDRLLPLSGTFPSSPMQFSISFRFQHNNLFLRETRIFFYVTLNL